MGLSKTFLFLSHFFCCYHMMLQYIELESEGRHIRMAHELCVLVGRTPRMNDTIDYHVFIIGKIGLSNFFSPNIHHVAQFFFFSIING